MEVAKEENAPTKESCKGPEVVSIALEPFQWGHGVTRQHRGLQL